MASPIARLSLLIGVSLLALSSTVDVAQAQRSNREEDKAEEAAAAKNKVLSERVFKQVTEGQTAFEEQRFADALRIFTGLLKLELTPYERAVVLQRIGYIYIEQDDYRRGTDFFEQALALNEFLPAEQRQIIFALAQLHLQLEQYDKSIARFKEWFAVAENPQPQAYVTFAYAYAQKEDFKNACPLVETAIKAAPDFRKDWYDFLAACQFQLRNLARVQEIYELLLERFPGEKVYFTQLAGLYAELKQDEKVLPMLELANKMGHLSTSEEFVQLAQLWMFNDVSYRGALILNEGLRSGKIKSTKDNWELLSNAYIASQEIEKAVEPLKKAAELSNDGELFVRLANVYLEKEEWKEAIATLDKGLSKGGLRNAGQAHFLEGVAYFNLNQLPEARRSLRRASEFTQSQRAARSWLTHVDNILAERARKEAEAAEQAAATE